VPIGGPYTGPTPYNTGQVTATADLGFWSGVGPVFSSAAGATPPARSGGHHAAGARGAAPSRATNTLDIFASAGQQSVLFHRPAGADGDQAGVHLAAHAQLQSLLGRRRQLLRRCSGQCLLHTLAVADVNKLGATWIEPNNGGPVGIGSSSGFSEIHFGPKVTSSAIATPAPRPPSAWSSSCPSAGASVLQDTGTLSLRRTSLRPAFGKFQYGSSTSMIHDRLRLRVDTPANDFLFSSFHLDYDIATAMCFTLIELNGFSIPERQVPLDFGFAARDLFNSGSNGTAGHDELTVGRGFRWKAIGERCSSDSRPVQRPRQPGPHLDAFGSRRNDYPLFELLSGTIVRKQVDKTPASRTTQPVSMFPVAVSVEHGKYADIDEPSLLQDHIAHRKGTNDTDPTGLAPAAGRSADPRIGIKDAKAAVNSSRRHEGFAVAASPSTSARLSKRCRPVRVHHAGTALGAAAAVFIGPRSRFQFGKEVLQPPPRDFDFGMAPEILLRRTLRAHARFRRNRLLRKGSGESADGFHWLLLRRRSRYCALYRAQA